MDSLGFAISPSSSSVSVITAMYNIQIHLFDMKFNMKWKVEVEIFILMQLNMDLADPDVELPTIR